MATIIAPATGLPTDIPDGPIQQTWTPDQLDQGEVWIPNSSKTPPDSQVGTNQPDGKSYIEYIREENSKKPLSELEQGKVYDNTVVEVDLFNRPPKASPTTEQKVVENPLLGYDTYTYSLSLHGITIVDYNNLVDDPKGYTPRHVLVAGAGRYSDTFVRNEHFKDTDFFFDNFRMNTIVAPTTRNKWSNLIECSFTIVEPLGFTFLQRLMSACMDPVSDGGMGGSDYLKQPFILQIDFFGHKHGVEANSFLTGTLKDHTKRIPIKLVSMKTKVTSRGTEYAIEAVPHNHTSFDPRNVYTPAEFGIKARTVQDVFGRGNSLNVAAQDTIRENREYADLASAFGPGTVVSQASGISGQFENYGICDALNDWWLTLQRKNSGTLPNTFTVLFDEEIGNSSLNEGLLGPVSNEINAGTDNKKTDAQSAGGINKSSISFSGQSVRIPAGASLGAIIEWAVTNSEWMKRQVYGDGAVISNNNQTAQIQKALETIKIVPKIKIGQYDYTRGEYSYDITIYVKKYTSNSKSTNGPLGKVPGFVKEYSYLYGGVQTTGDSITNRDVLDLQIDFNMLFYTQITAFKNKQQQFRTGKGIGATPDDIVEQPNALSGEPSAVEPGQQNPGKIPGLNDRIMPFGVHTVSGDVRTASASGSNPAGRVAASEILNNQLVKTAQGDMINVKLRIIGDPTFIKQDDIFYNSGLSYASTLLTENNSLIMDDGELYVYIHFRSPADYDEATGLAIPGLSRYGYSEFSGTYKLIQIENSFARGKFEQTLDLVRVPIADQKLRLAVGNTQRAQALLAAGLGQGTRFPRTGSFGPRIIGSVASGTAAGQIQQLANGIISNATNQVIQKAMQPVNEAVSDLVTSFGDKVSGLGGDISRSIEGFFYNNSNGIPTDLAVVGDFGLGEDLVGSFNEIPLPNLNINDIGVDFDL